MLFLKNLILDPKFNLDLLGKDLNCSRKEILKFCFNNKRSNIFLNELEKINQLNYYSIQDYVNDIEKKLTAYSVASDMTSTETKRKYEDCFKRGLGPYTKLELFNRGILGLEESVNFLKELEDNLIIAAEENSLLTKSTKPQDKKNLISHDIGKKKYCKLHNTTSHSTFECRLRNKKDKVHLSNPSRNNEKNFILREKETTIKTLKAVININNKDIEAVIDTGSSNNFIRSALCEELNLTPQCEKETLIETGSGEVIKSTKVTEISFKWKNNEENIKDEFFLLNNLPCDLILGNKFLARNNCIIDFKNLIFISDGKKIAKLNDRDENSDVDHDPDKKIFEKCFYISTDYTILKVIDKYKEVNEKQTLKINPVKLNIKKIENPIQSKPFNIPYKYHQEVNEELSRLKKEGTIEKKQLHL